QPNSTFATIRKLLYKNHMEGGPQHAPRGAKPRSSRPWSQSDRKPAFEGFSLIELLVVIALIIVLTTMYWGSNSGSRQKKLQASCQDNLQKIYIAMEIFAKDHNDKFPEKNGALHSEEPLDLLVPKYTSDTSVFICPGSKDASLPSGEPFGKHIISYAYYMGRRLA